jgi:hypothetical protein
MQPKQADRSLYYGTGWQDRDRPALVDTVWRCEQNMITVNKERSIKAHTVSTLGWCAPVMSHYGEGGVDRSVVPQVL